MTNATNWMQLSRKITRRSVSYEQESKAQKELSDLRKLGAEEVQVSRKQGGVELKFTWRDSNGAPHSESIIENGYILVQF